MEKNEKFDEMIKRCKAGEVLYFSTGMEKEFLEYAKSKGHDFKTKSGKMLKKGKWWKK